MRYSMLPTALLAFQGASFALGGVIRAREGENLPVPSEDDFKEGMEPYLTDDFEFIFYMGKSKAAAIAWAQARSEDLKPVITLWTTDNGEWNDDARKKYQDPDEMQKEWCRVFSKEAQGTAWFMHRSADKFDPSEQSWWNTVERPVLEARDIGPGNDLEEIIQINEQNTNEIHQIMPVDVSDYKGKECHWTECGKKCHDDFEKVTESKYGDTPNQMCDGRDRKRFCCKD